MNPRPSTPEHTSGAREGRHFPSPLAAFGITFGAFFVTAFFVVLQSEFTEQITYGALGVGGALGLGIAATIAARFVPEPRVDRLGLVGFAPSTLPWLALLLPLVVVTTQLDAWITPLFEKTESVELAQKQLAELLGDPTPLSLLQIAIVSVGLAPVVEEFMFRGVIQQGVIAYLGRVGGILFTAMLFVIFRLDASPDYIGSVAIGIVLGIVRIATGSLLAAIALHGAWAALLFVATHLRDSVDLELRAVFATPEANAAPEIVIASLVTVAAGLFLFGRAMGEAPVALPVPPPEDEDD